VCLDGGLSFHALDFETYVGESLKEARGKEGKKILFGSCLRLVNNQTGGRGSSRGLNDPYTLIQPSTRKVEELFDMVLAL